MSADSMYVMSPLEVALGWVFGSQESADDRPIDHRAETPRQALEKEILGSLQRPPCGVSFSGGRDSSTILAIAADVARREGLPAPIPVTKIYPEAPETDESSWQGLVIDHIGLSDWVKIELTDELDLIGPMATELLARHGVVWPPLLVTNVPVFEVVRGGTLLTGEYGDEVLGVEEHRVAPINRLLTAPRTMRRHDLRDAAHSLAPARWRARHELGDAEAEQRWLRPAANDMLRQLTLDDERRRPLGYAASVHALRRERSSMLASHNEHLLATANGVVLNQPLGEPAVIEALAQDGGWLGRGDRTAVLRALAGDLLPDAVLTRTSKVHFDSVFITDRTRDFARQWSGDGLDDALVDAEVLREVWISDERPAQADALLQAAWLHSQNHGQ